MNTTQRAKKFFFTATEAIVGFALVFALLEGALRLFPGLIPLPLLVGFEPSLRSVIAGRRHLPTEQTMRLLERDDGGPPLRVYQPLAEITYEFNDPGTVRTVKMDRAGFCNPEENAYDRSAFDLVTIGDSFTWCMTVNPQDAWPHQFAMLTGRSVYNLGVAGRGLHEYIQILKQFGLQKSPRVVVMNVYEGNDLRDADQYHRYVREVRDSGGTSPTSTPCTIPYTLCVFYRVIKEGPVGRRSYAFNLTAAAIRSGRDRVARMWDRPDASPAGEENFRYTVRANDLTVQFNPENSDLDEVTYAKRLRAGEVGLELFQDALENFVTLAGEHGFIPVVTYTPSAYTAYADSVEFKEPAVEDIMQWFSARQREYFKTESRELGYTFIDFTPALAAASDTAGGLLYFPTNLHLTALGHRVVAEALAGEIRLLPSGRE